MGTFVDRTVRWVVVGKMEKLIAQWVAANRKDLRKPVRGYVTRYETSGIDTECVRREAAAASELAKRYLSDR